MRAVIVISDEEGTRESLRQVLAPEYVVLATETANEAAHVLASLETDLLIYDAPASFPEMLRTLETFWEIDPDVVAVSLLVTYQNGLSDEAKKRGVFEVLPKPFDTRKLRETVARGVARRDQIRLERAASRKFEDPEPISNDLPPRGTRETLPDLTRLSRVLVDVADFDELLSRSLAAVVEVFGCSSIALYLDVRESGRFELKAGEGLESAIRDYPFTFANSLVRELARNRSILRIGPRLPDDLRREMLLFRGVLTAPLLRLNGLLFGWIGLGGRRTGLPYFEVDVETLARLSPILSSGLENALRCREAFSRKREAEKVIRECQEGLIVVDHTGRVTGVSATAEAWLTLSSSGWMGKKIQKIGSAAADLLLRTLERETELEKQDFFPAGSSERYTASTRLLRDEKGRVVGATMAFRPISSGNELAGNLTDVQLEEMAELSAWVAHLVRNRLVPIKTFTDLLPGKHEDKEFRESFAGVVGEEVERLGSVVDRLTEFGEPVDPEMEIVEAGRVVEKAIARMANVLEETGTDWEKRLEEELPVQADPGLLCRALACFFEEVARSSPDSGKLRFEASRLDREGTAFASLRLYCSGYAARSTRRLDRLFERYGEEAPDFDVFRRAWAQKVIRLHQGYVEEGRNKEVRDIRIYLPLAGA